MVAVALAARSRTASGLLDCDVHPAQMATRASDHGFFMNVRMPADERWIASGCVVLAIIIHPAGAWTVHPELGECDCVGHPPKVFLRHPFCRAMGRNHNSHRPDDMGNPN